MSVWIDRFSYRPGQRIRAFFQSDPGAYVTILRVSTSGDLRVLYPRTPSTQQPYRVDRLVDDEVPYSTSLGFYLNEPEGVGFVFAVASFEPFDYRSVTSAGEWSTYQLTGSGYRDPYEVVSRFISRTQPTWVDSSTDYIQYQIAGTLYRPRRYADQGYYDDIYNRCMRYYLGRADYYCRQYGYFGNSPYYYPVAIGRNPRPTPSPVTPGKTRPALPKKLGSEPHVKEEGIKPQTPAQRSPTGNADLQRAWWNAQKRDADRSSGGATVFRAGVRVDPQTPTPSDFRNLPVQPRINVRSESRNEPMPQRRFEPSSQPRYEPEPQRRFETPVIRSEPSRSEPVTRAEPIMRSGPVMRSEPVQRSEPAPREFHPAPAPPPPPPPPPPAPVDRGDPAPRTLPSAPPPPPPPSS